MVLRQGMALLRRTRRKGIVLLAIICISSSTLLRIFIQGERMFNNYYQHETARRGPTTELLHVTADIDTRSSLYAAGNRSSNRTEDSPSPSQCKEKHCTDRLSPDDLALYRHCTASAAKRVTLVTDSNTPDCHFINGSHRYPVALASFPGSGNTWLRGLLELATNICTGSIYCDRDLRAGGFAGEGLYSSSTLVVKTHKGSIFVKLRHHLRKELNVSSVVLLIRNPFNVLVAERNREVAKAMNRSNSHLSVAGEDSFGENKEWRNFVNIRIYQWSKMLRYWLVNSTRPVLIVKYEDMKQDPALQVKRILHFINYHHLTDEELRIKLKDGYNKYHRPVKNERKSYYTNEQIQIINHHIKMAAALLRTNPNRKYNLTLSSYLRQID